MTIQQVHVKKDELTHADLVHVEPGDLADGAVRLEIESFSVTANNITYAVVGDGFGYWNFFPAPDGLGIVPMWGHAKVMERSQRGSGSMATCRWRRISMCGRATSRPRVSWTPPIIVSR